MFELIIELVIRVIGTALLACMIYGTLGAAAIEEEAKYARRA